MSSLQAALGLAQLERVAELVERKRTIFGWYREGFDGVKGVVLNYSGPMVMNAYWMVTAVIGPEHEIAKEEMMAALDADGITTRPFFYPLSSLPAYEATPQASAARERNRIAYSVARRGINLPSALNLTREQVAYVCDRFRRVLAHKLAA